MLGMACSGQLDQEAEWSHFHPCTGSQENRSEVRLSEPLTVTDFLFSKVPSLPKPAVFNLWVTTLSQGLRLLENR